ncbi:MAG: hypothetical protein Fur0018_04730 [Anaerolineales bacterium]
MMSHTLRPVLYLVAFMLIVSMACTIGGGPAPTPTLEPTQPPPPTATATNPPPPTATNPPPPPTATTEAVAPPSPPPSAAFQLDNVTSSYADGVYEVYAPTGWEVKEGTASVSFSEPAGGGDGFIYLQATNTGAELDFESFQRFVEAREANFFGTYSNYQQIDIQYDEAKSLAYVVKLLDYDNVPQKVETLYDQQGQIVYALDFWADAAVYDQYVDQFDAFFNGITVNSTQAAKSDLYNWVWTFTGPADLFTIKVPTSWRYERSTGTDTIVDTFYSPDEHAVIQNITYDDGTAISKSDAGAFALELLRTYYATDIVITGDKVQPDGSERLTWNSPGGNYTGISFFESRGTTFLLFTVMYDNPYEDTYFDSLNYVISTYDVP